MNQPTTKDEILGYECRFAVYCPPQDGSRNDLHTVKEIMHVKKPDGTVEQIPRLRRMPNYKRPFWATKEGYRKHKDKKEWELKSRVLQFECTQTDLVTRAAMAVGEGWRLKNGRNDIRAINDNPYLYGTDILSTACIKRYYQDTWPQLNTPYSVACFDVETDVLHGTNEIIMATLSFKQRVFTAVKKSFVAGQADVISRLHEKLQKYLGAMEHKDKDGNDVVTNYLAKRGIQWEVILVDSEIDIVKAVFEKAHEWKPDFFAIWNMDFDIPKVLAACERARVNPADLFSDPSVPMQYRHFEYKPGAKQKKTASGKVTPKRNEERWHTVFAPSSFYVIDAMCAYNFVRTGSQKEQSYSLNAMLEKHLGVRKLHFAEAEGYVGIEYHQFMQDRHPLEYVIYNVFDCVSMEELDEKTNDLSLSVPLFSKCSDFQYFASQPRRLADDLHYFCLANDRVMGSTNAKMAGEFDEQTVDLEGWIVTLPAHLVLDNGLQIIKENYLQVTNIRAHVGDLDVSASYPNGEAVFNISKETTHKELIEIDGISEYDTRMQGLNLSAGHVNAVEICTTFFGLPQMDAMLEAFEKEINAP